MANRRKGPRMRQEIKRHKLAGLGIKAIAAVLHISKNTVRKYLQGNQTEVEEKKSYSPSWAAYVDWTLVHAQVEKGDALGHWWENNIKAQTTGDLAGLGYVSFWREFRRRFPRLDLEFHKTHPPAERCEADFKGDAVGLGYTDRGSGQFVPCRLFGAVLCYSQLFRAVARPAEKQTDWLSGLETSFDYFGGVSKLLSVDNAKAAVQRADWWDPDLNPEFARFCQHYQLTPVIARPRRPKDKNLIEGALGVFWRWARSKIAGRDFFSLGQLDEYLRDLCDEFNSRVQRKYSLSRMQRYEAQEKVLMKPLPQQPFELAEWKKAKVHPDCHVQVKKNFFSVPYTLRGQELNVRLTLSYVEIFHKMERVALHHLPTSNQQGRYITEAGHLPKAHQAMLEATPQRILQDALAVGSQTHAIIQRLIQEASHPLAYLRRCQGIVRLKKRYGAVHLESVSALLNGLGQKMPKLRDFENLLKNPKLMESSVSTPIVQRKHNVHLRGQMHWSLYESKQQGDLHDETA